MKTSLMRRVDLQAVGAGKLEGDIYKFTAKSISNNELCEPMMKIALQQVNNLPLLFRHRHPAANEEKAIPIFGRSVGGRIENEGDLKYLVIDYEIPLKSPDGHELVDKQLFADWVKESAEAGNPIGISLAFIQHLEDGRAYWVDVYEASGTHVPACKSCRHVLEHEKNEQGEMDLPEDGTKKIDTEKERYEMLESKLEKLTKEKTELESKLDTAEKDKKSAVDNLKAENDKFAAETARLTARQVALEDRLDYAETKKPLVDVIMKHEKRPELEPFYRKQTLEYLQAQVKKFESFANAPNIAPTDATGTAMEKAAKQKLEMTTGSKENAKKALEQVAPDLRARMVAFWKEQGMDLGGGDDGKPKA